MTVGGTVPARAYAVAALRAAWVAMAGLCALALLSSAVLAKPFRAESFNYYMNDYTAELQRLAKTIDLPIADLQTEVTTAEAAGNARQTAVAMERLLSKSPNDAALWLRLAQQLVSAQPFNDQDGYQLPPKIIASGLKAYLLASAAPEEASSLAIAAQGFARRENWRPALQAYKESLRLVEDAEVRQAYEQMREEHGFRITDYKIENDATPPRVCFELSDPVSNAVADFSPYFRQDPGPLSAVTAEGGKLCVEGLKHGARYKITARKGLPSSVDEDLARDYEYEFYVRDRDPSVRFSGKNYVLPRTGQNGVPLISINSESAKLTLYRIGDRSLIDSVIDSNFLQQIDGYAADTIADRRGAKVWEGTLDTPAPLNEEITTAFPVDEAMGKLAPGLYVMTAEPAAKVGANEYDNIATQWFVVSDLGLSTLKGKDGLHVSVRSIATADPIADVELRLIARNNEVLATVKTKADGSATFDPGLLKGESGLSPALVVAFGPDDDYGFLDIQQAAFDLSDRGVAGRDPPGAVDAFVYVERGVYRRGETVHAAVLLRNDQANAVPGMPITLIVERPDGVEYSRTTLADQGAGGRTLDIPIIASAAGGTWRVKAHTDPQAAPVGETSFLVEDYIPDRIEFDLTALSQIASVEQGAKFAVDGRYLFGAPGAGLELEGDIAVIADDRPFEQWSGYRFGLTDERVDGVQNTADNLPDTDAKGHAEFDVRLPELPTTTRPLKAKVTVRMREPGGRAVEKNASLPVRAVRPLIGIKPGFDVNGAPESQALTFQVVAIDAAGKPVEAKAATWSLKRLNTTYQWFWVGGSWRYEAITRATKISGGPVDIGSDKPAVLSQALSWGKYRLEVTADGFAPASVDFSSGYYYAGDSADSPDTLQVALDKTSVKTGDTINIKIDSRFAGKASLQVVGDRLLASQSVDVPEGGTSVPVTVGEGWGTGAYALVTLYRPIDVAAKRMPARAVGVAWFGIGRDERTLDVKLSVPANMKPRQTLKVPVKIGGVAVGEHAYVTVAAVDVGILNLTRYKPPEPESYYYDQKRLTSELRDLYGRLIDGMQGERGRIRSGGDGGGGFGAPPPTQPPLSLFSGMVQVGPDGIAEVNFDVPAFNGTVRVMAVAWTEAKVGHAVADVIVRDPLVIAGTLPRFLAVGDQSRFRLDFINAEAEAGEYSLAVTLDGPVSAGTSMLNQKVTIGGAGARVPVNIPITASEVGTATLVARLTGPGGVDVDQTYTLNILPANPSVTRRMTKELAQAGGSITVSNDLLAEMVPGTGAVSLSVGPLPELDAASLIRDLDRYPYGCSEQTVSRAMPLLYLSELGAKDIPLDTELKKRLEDAVARLVNRQSSSGAFGAWQAYSDENLWLSAFVTDFLLRAREKGFTVPEESLLTAIDYLRNRVGNAPDIENGKGEDIAYALYALARAGKAPAGDLKYLADTKLNNFGSPLARAQLAAALSIIGDKPRSDAAFAAALTALAAADTGTRPYRYDYGTVLRDASAILALAGDTKSGGGVIKAAAQVIATERAKTRYTSTQEMAWMVLAARAMAEEAKTLKLEVNGTPQTGALYTTFDEAELSQPYRVTNPGPNPLRAIIAVSGSPVAAEPAAANGLRIERTYYTPAGEATDPASVKRNTRLVVVLSVAALGDGEQPGDYLLADQLPAGFEIENPALVSSGDTSGFAWLEGTTWAIHTEFRDDRFVAAFNSSTARFAYTVRAVAPGTYIHPGAAVEDMYRPEINARTATGTVMVTE